MNRAARLGRVMVNAAAACAMWAACKAKPPSGAPPAATRAETLTATAVPADQLAPGELLEGSERAYGLALPQGMRIDARFSTETSASGPMSIHALVEYFRARLHDGDVREGDSSATFDHVTVVGNPTPPLSIHIALVRGVARVQIQNETPIVLPALPDDEARLRRAGLTPSGRIADPAHLD